MDGTAVTLPQIPPCNVVSLWFRHHLSGCGNPDRLLRDFFWPTDLPWTRTQMFLGHSWEFFAGSMLLSFVLESVATTPPADDKGKSCEALKYSRVE